MERNSYYMRLALREAEAALSGGEVPIGAVMVADGEVVVAVEPDAREAYCLECGEMFRIINWFF